MEHNITVRVTRNWDQPWWLAECDRCDLRHNCTDRDHALRTVRALHAARQVDRATEARRAVEHGLGGKLGGRS